MAVVMAMSMVVAVVVAVAVVVVVVGRTAAGGAGGRCFEGCLDLFGGDFVSYILNLILVTTDMLHTEDPPKRINLILDVGNARGR